MDSKLIQLRSNPICSPSTAYYSTHFPDEDSRLYHPSSIIFSHATSCFHLFEKLLNSEIFAAFGRGVPLSRWTDELGRLRVWCSNTGVYLNGDSSLDYRLRDSPHLVGQVVRQLDRLRRVLRDLQSIPEMLEADDSDTESEDINPEDEVQEMYSDLLDIVSGLFEIATIIQKPTSHNLNPAKELNMDFWRLDQQFYLHHNYPQIKRKIIDRLGSAMSSRRVLLTSREENFRKASLCHDVSAAYFASSKAIVKRLEQTCSDVVGLTSNPTNPIAHSHEAHSESFALVLPPSDAVDGATFECPLCFFMIDATDKESWMHHLALDLMPYVCIFENCDTANSFYGKKDVWLDHLQTVHDFESISLESQNCPLCFQTFTSGYDVGSHIARHLEDIAVLSIPPEKIAEEKDFPWTSAREETSRSVKSDVTKSSESAGRRRDLTRGPQYFKCEWDGCAYYGTFDTQVDLWRHVRATHVSPKNYKCPICNQSFLRIDKLGEHMRAAHTSTYCSENEGMAINL